MSDRNKQRINIDQVQENDIVSFCTNTYGHYTKVVVEEVDSKRRGWMIRHQSAWIDVDDIRPATLTWNGKAEEVPSQILP